MEARSPVTLHALTVLARFFSRIRYFAWAVVVIAAAWFVAVVLDAETHSSNALLALSILLWGGLALGCGWLLVRQPPAPEPGDRWLQSLRKRALRAAFVMAAVGLVALTGLVLKLSYSAVVLNFG